MSKTIISDKTMNIHVCRICLNSDCVNKVVLDEQNGWLMLFEYCFGLSLTIQDEPRVICGKCANNVENYSQFKKQCLKTNQLWKAVSVNVKCSIEKTALEHKVKIEQNDGDLLQPNIMARIENDSDCSNDVETHSIPSEIKVEEEENIFLNNNPFLYEEKDEKNFDNLNKKEKFESCVEKNKIRLTENTKVKQIHQCKYCSKIYEKKKWYIVHLKKCQLKGRKRISQDLVIKSDSSLASHLKKIKNNQIIDEYSDNPMFFCGVCKLNFPNSSDNYKHLDEHWSHNDVACQFCDFIGADVAALAAHRYVHYPPKRLCNFICHICEKKKPSKLALEFHYRLEHLKKKGGLCSTCHTEYDTLKNLKKHLKSHGIGMDFICDLCGKRFYFKYEIRNHIIGHMHPPKFVCETCGNIFTRARYLKLHMATVHVKTDPIKCTHCNRMFKSQYHLNFHLKLKNMEKIYKCEVCFNEYPRKAMLKSHMVMHSVERPHCCHICGARYKAKCALRIHLRRHTGYFPFKCEICSKSFPTPRQLRIHSAVHTGIRNYKCSYCVRSFNEKRLLMQHCAKIHNNETIKQSQ